MIARGILRGGLAGGLLAAAFSVLGLIPICGFFSFPLRVAAWAFAGYLAGRIALGGGARTGGAVAGLGAGVIAGLFDGVINIALAPLAFKIMGNQVEGLFLLPEPVLKYFQSLGVDLLQLNTVGGSIFFAVMFCGVAWLMGGVIGMLGGGVAQSLADYNPCLTQSRRAAKEEIAAMRTSCAAAVVRSAAEGLPPPTPGDEVPGYEQRPVGAKPDSSGAVP